MSSDLVTVVLRTVHPDECWPVTSGEKPPFKGLCTGGEHCEESLPAVSGLPPLKMDVADIAVWVLTLQNKTRALTFSTQEAVINVWNGRISSKNDQALEQLLVQAENVAKSKKGGKWMKVFSWVSVVLLTVVAIVTVNPVLMAAAAISIAMLVATETGAMEKLEEKMGTKAFVALMVVIAVVMVVCTAGAGSGMAAATLSRTAVIVTAAAQTAAAGAAIASGVSQIITAKFAHNAAMAAAAVTRFLAQVEENRGELEDQMDIFVESIEKGEVILRAALDLIYENGKLNSDVASRV